MRQRVVRLLEEHREERSLLNTRYNRKFRELEVSSYGEIPEEELSALDKWYKEEEALLEKNFNKKLYELVVANSAI